MEIFKLIQRFGKESQNKISVSGDKTIAGALACLETFYYAFNHQDIATFRLVWPDHALIQLNNPLGGMIYGTDKIVELYNDLFRSQASVWVDFNNILVFRADNMLTFAGQETGEFTKSGETLMLKIRTTRIFAYSEVSGRWCLVHHHGSIDNPELLRAYQNAVNGE